MIKAGLTKRYAKALLELAQAKQQQAAFGRALHDFVELLQQNEELGRMIYGKMMSTSDKKKLIGQILAKDNAPEEVQNFINVILDKGREASLPEFLAAYEALCDEADGIQQIEVYTAMPLTEEKQTALEEALAAKLNAKIRLKTQVDKSLIGGIKVQIDDTVYDASISQQLRSLKESLMVD